MTLHCIYKHKESFLIQYLLNQTITKYNFMHEHGNGRRGRCSCCCRNYWRYGLCFYLFIYLPDYKIRGSLNIQKKFQKIEFNPLLQLGTVEYYLVDTFVNYLSKFICVVRKACLKFVYDLLTLSWRKSQSYRKHSTDLQSKSMD